MRRPTIFTPDSQALTDWLLACGVDTVPMESTGVYRIPVFEILEGRGLIVYLLNAWHLKHVPGRKSDYMDRPWIQKLHGLGLLTESFRADGEMCARRAYLRYRAQLLEYRTPYVMIRLKGVGLVAVEGISASLAQTILSEIGADRSKRLNEKHFASCLGSAPHNDSSGETILRTRTLTADNRGASVSAGSRLRIPAKASAVRVRASVGSDRAEDSTDSVFPLEKESGQVGLRPLAV